MRLGTIAEAWEQYLALLERQMTPPPAGIWVMQDDVLLAGCCVYDGGGICAATSIATSLELAESGEMKALRFLFRALEGHALVVGKAPIVDPTGIEELVPLLPLVTAGLLVVDWAKPIEAEVTNLSNEETRPDDESDLAEAPKGVAEDTDTPVADKPATKPRAKARRKRQPARAVPLKKESKR